MQGSLMKISRRNEYRRIVLGGYEDTLLTNVAQYRNTIVVIFFYSWRNFGVKRFQDHFIFLNGIILFF